MSTPSAARRSRIGRNAPRRPGGPIASEGTQSDRPDDTAPEAVAPVATHWTRIFYCDLLAATVDAAPDAADARNHRRSAA